MNFKKIIELASKIKNVGNNRIKINNSKINEEFKPEYSREAVKKYLADGFLTVRKIKGTTRHVKKLPARQEKGKTKWITQVRRLRNQLKQTREEISLNNKIYRKIYLRIKANIIKTRKQLKTEKDACLPDLVVL